MFRDKNSFPIESISRFIFVILYFLQDTRISKISFYIFTFQSLFHTLVIISMILKNFIYRIWHINRCLSTRLSYINRDDSYLQEKVFVYFLFKSRMLEMTADKIYKYFKSLSDFFVIWHYQYHNIIWNLSFEFCILLFALFH